MIQLEEFTASLARDEPDPALSTLLQALWHEARGDWDRAHKLTQKQDSPEAAWVHAYLHRVEGDLGNANYWYQRSEKPFYYGNVKDEWKAIARELLGRSEAM